MRSDKLTLKTRDALAGAGAFARDRAHATVDPEHLLHALLGQDASVVPRVLALVGTDTAQLTAALDQHLGRLPQCLCVNGVVAST